MKKLAITIALALALITGLGVAAPGKAMAKDWSLTLDSTFNSYYVWRGVRLNNGPVWQPSATFGYKGLSLNVWGNFDLDNVNGYEFEFSEVDYTASYGFSLGPVGLEFGVIYYDFPASGASSTTEIYGSASLNVLLTPTLKIYKDVDVSEGLYANLGISHSFKLAKNVGLDLGLSVGWGDKDGNAFVYGAAKEGLADLMLTAGVPITLDKGVTITPMANFSTLLSDDLRDAQANPNSFWLGLSISWEI